MTDRRVVVAVQTWELQLPGCQSLKEKRSLLQPLKITLRRSLNISVSETGAQDAWQAARLACAAVGTERTVVQETLRSADRLIEEADGVRITNTDVAFL